MTLDESRDNDKRVEVRGLTFVLDNYSTMFVEEILVDFDDYEDGFVVHNLTGPDSSC
ncbi:MAG: hypothetical protein ACXVOI_11535 [Tumebacillaceae bacterium]